MTNVEFNYQGGIILIQCNENDKLKKIIQNFCIKVQKSKENLCFLYGGQIISNYDLTFNELASQIDKSRKMMSVLVINTYYNNESSNQNSILEFKEKLDNADKTISEQKAQIQDLKYQITMVKSESMNQINNLMNIIEKKDEQLNQLKEQMKNIFCPKCKEKINLNNNFLLNKNIKIKTFHLINDTIPIVNIQNSPNWIKKYSLRVLKDSFYEEGFQILSLKGNTLIGVLEGPPNTPFEDGYFLFKNVISFRLYFQTSYIYFYH